LRNPASTTPPPAARRRKKWPRALAACLLLWLAGWYALPFLVPLPENVLEPSAGKARWLDRNGQLLRRPPAAIQSHPSLAPNIPRDLIDCTLAAEDKRFLQHRGVDFLALARSARDCLRYGRAVSGASTITQQLVKISSPPARRTLGRKTYEILAARRLEMSHPKQAILLAYLHKLDYGNQRQGPANAAWFYFQKPLADLSLAESALLAGLPQAPSRLNPLRHPDRALARREIVLDRLARRPGADTARIAAARLEPAHIRPLEEPALARWLLAAPPTLHPPRPSHTATITTTLDPSLQREAERIVAAETARLRSSGMRHAAVVILHNPSREILTLVSSADWHDPQGGQINGALTPRSPGSALKPFTYLLALENNSRTPASILADIPTPFRTPEGIQLPGNFDRTYRGPVTLRHALACSLNIPALRELNSLGGEAPLARLLESLDVTIPPQALASAGLGLTLGNAPVRLLDLANAYATLASGGLHQHPTLFLPPPLPPSPPRRLFSESSAFAIQHILADPAARAPAFPPGGPLDLPFPCAVKTGTSSNYRDNWCIGFTREFTVAVWAGNFEARPMQGVSGVAGAGPIFQALMLRLHHSSPPSLFPTPAHFRTVTIDARNGLLLADSPPSPHARRDLLPASQIPPAASPLDFDPQGRAWIGPEFREWFESPHNHRRGELALRPSQSPPPLAILHPRPGETYLLDPDIPSGSHRLTPRANRSDNILWSSPSLEISPTPQGPECLLRPGTHEITATCPQTQESQTITISVRNL
jgi:penicillin-binding protein 1C